MKKKFYPLVTVYIPTHNRQTSLENTLISVFNQTYSNIEIIVVDDGSTDDTYTFMQTILLKHSNVRYFKFDIASGANVARNHAIKKAKGYFITGIDDDDEMLPRRIEKLVKAYDNKYAYITSRFNTIRKDNYVSLGGSKKQIITLDDMLYGGNLTGNQVLATREMFFQAGLFDEDLVAAQDYDMWIRMLKIKPFAKVLAEPLQNVYQHSDNRITSSSRKYKGYFACYLKHKNIMNDKHRKSNLLYFNHLKGRNIHNKRIQKLYDCYELPKAYLVYYKRKLFTFIQGMKK